jgi:succinoglycan biosynthesis transport protein ExoP
MDKQIIGRPYEGPTELVRFADPAPYASPPPSQGLSLGRILGIIRGRLLIFAIALIVLMALATVGILNLKRSYQSDALLVIEPNKPHVTNLQAIEDAPEIRSDLVVIWSQIQILESDTLARKVVTAMHLQNDPAFAEAPPIWTAWLNWISKLPGLAAINSAPEPKTDAQLINETIVRYKQRFSAYSDGKSFVIATSFSAPDPDLARRILAEHLKVYLDDQTIAKQAIIGKADVWFQGELSEMQTKLQQAEAKQQMFRDDNHLLRTGADAETIAGRQLSTVTGQLADARADLARKEARYNEIASLAASKSVDAVSEDPTIMASPLIQRLREQEATAAQRLVEQQQRG